MEERKEQRAPAPQTRKKRRSWAARLSAPSHGAWEGQRQLPEEHPGGHWYLVIRIQRLKGLLFDEFFHFFHIRIFYPVVEVPQPQDHTAGTEHKGHRD